MTVHVARTPWLTAARAQFRLLWWSRRAMMLLAIVLGMYAAIEGALRVAARYEGLYGEPAFRVVDLLGVLVVVGFGWGIAVWRGESAQQRTQMLSAPLDVSRHELARVGAGAAWLLVTIALLVAAGILATLTAGGAAAIAAVRPLAWVLLFTAPLLAYAFAVPVSTATPRALEYTLLAYALFLLLVLLVSLAGWDATLDRVLRPIFGGRFGVGAAITGSTTAAARAAGHTAGSWLIANVVWFGVAAAALYGVLRWRRGRI